LPAQQERLNIVPLIQLLEVLVVVGILLWLVDRFVPMQRSIKSILNGVVVVAVALWLCNVFGLFHSFPGSMLEGDARCLRGEPSSLSPQREFMMGELL
jgi:hypothetical protein